MKLVLKNAVKKLLRSKSEPLITVTISKSALYHNLEQFKKVEPRNEVVPVLKSNAYGHGLVQIASLLEDRVNLFIIDSYFEAEYLRSVGISKNLLVIGYVRPETIKVNRLRNISYTISSLDTLYSLKSNRKTRIHLKIDTGMNRQGITVSEIPDALSFIKSNKNIILEGICSHLADADGVSDHFTKKQISLWNKVVSDVKKEFPNIKYVHLSNTAGHKFSNEIEANTSRLGIGLYGLIDIPGYDLRLVLEMHTIITGIKKIKEGEMVGYNTTYTASKDSVLATIPVGYYEGLNRKLSNKGFVKVRDTFCPIVGRVSMNITTIDITQIDSPKIGESIQVISSNKLDRNSIKSIAELSETITYEIAVKIPAHLKRLIVD